MPSEQSEREPEGGATDRRGRRRRDERRLFLAVLAFLLIGGGIAIWIAYGERALLLGIGCLLAGGLVLLALWGVLEVMDRLSR